MSKGFLAVPKARFSPVMPAFDQNDAFIQKYYIHVYHYYLICLDAWAVLRARHGDAMEESHEWFWLTSVMPLWGSLREDCID
eukprot:scaffold165380_cov24-Tisochrysis_lutea.AAC.3